MTPKTHADKKASGIEHADTLCGDDVRDVVAERAQWEDMTFAIGGRGLVVVANESHGRENAGEHTYVVIVEDGAAVECTCPYALNGGRGGDACKHRVACAMRPAVMAAAEATDDEHERANDEPVILADGGTVVSSVGPQGSAGCSCTCSECACLCEIDPDGPGCFEHYEGSDR